MQANQQPQQAPGPSDVLHIEADDDDVAINSFFVDLHHMEHSANDGYNYGNGEGDATEGGNDTRDNGTCPVGNDNREHAAALQSQLEFGVGLSALSGVHLEQATVGTREHFVSPTTSEPSEA